MEIVIRYIFAFFVFSVVAGAIILGWKVKLHPEKIKDRELLRYGHGSKLIAVICAIAAAMSVGAAFNSEPGEEYIASILIAIFCPIAVLVGLEVFFVRVEFDDKNIYTYSPWRRNRLISWDDVSGHKYVGYHVIETNNNGSIFLHDIDGLQGFLEEVHRHLLEKTS